MLRMSFLSSLLNVYMCSSSRFTTSSFVIPYWFLAASWLEIAVMAFTRVVFTFVNPNSFNIFSSKQLVPSRLCRCGMQRAYTLSNLMFFLNTIYKQSSSVLQGCICRHANLELGLLLENTFLWHSSLPRSFWGLLSPRLLGRLHCSVWWWVSGSSFQNFLLDKQLFTCNLGL
jgi:hypothetical protein